MSLINDIYRKSDFEYFSYNVIATRRKTNVYIQGALARRTAKIVPILYLVEKSYMAWL